MRTAIISLFIVSSLSPAQCNPLLTTSLASEPPPPSLNSVFPAGSKKMEVKWEPFRDIFENIIRPIGGENDVATMLENVKEEDIDTLEGTLLDKAKDDPEFVEQILTHLIHIRERYIKLRQDWQKTIEDRDKTAKIFKARIVDTRSDPSSALLPSNGQPVQFTQSFTPNTGLTNVSPVLNTNPLPLSTRPPPPVQPFFNTPAAQEQSHFTMSSETLPDSQPPQLDQEELEEDPGSFLAPPSHSSPPSDFFFVPNHVIDPQIDPNQIIFDTAIPQFASRGSPPAPPPHVAARRATAAPTTQPPTTTTTQRPTRPWHFSSRATTTIRPETKPWWWTKKTTRVATTSTPRTTTRTTTTTTTEAPTTQAERSETKAGIHFDHENNRTVYRYFWKPNTEEQAVIPEMIDENGNEHSAVTVETEEKTTEVAPPPEDVVFEDPQPEEETTPATTTTTPEPTTTTTTTPRPPPTTTTRRTTTRPPPTTTTRRPTTFTTAGPRRPTLFERVPEFAPRQPKIIRTSLFDPPPQEGEEHEVQQNRPQGFRTPTGSRTFGPLPTAMPQFASYEELPIDEHPLEPWAPTQRPSTTTTAPSTTMTTRRPPQTIAPTTSTTRVTTTTSAPTTSTTEEPIAEAQAEVVTVPEFAVEDISHFTDDFTEQSVDERELVNILNKEEEQRGVVEAKWFSGPNSFDKDQQHLSGSPKRFIPEFPGEVDPETFPEGEATTEEDAQTPKRIVFTVQPVTKPATISPTTVEQTTEPSTTPIEETPSIGFTDETAEEFEGVTVSTAEQIEDTTETIVDEIIDDTAEELSQAFADFERTLSTRATEGPIEPPTTSTTTETPSTVVDEVGSSTAQQTRQGVRAPTVIVWGRRPPKQPSTIVHLDTAPPSIRPTKRPRTKTTKVPAEIDLLDELIRGTTEHVETTTRSISELENELAREAKINSFFESEESTTRPHDDARIRGRTPGRKIRGRKGQHKRVDTSHFIVSALNRDGVHLSHEEARIALGLPGKASRPHLKTITPPSTTTDDGIQLLVADLQRELLTRGFNEQTFAVCNAINCDFEKNDELCQYESSLDELIFGEGAFRRVKRQAFDSFITVRSWTNWGGAKGDPTLGNIALAAGRLPSDVFSQGKNERFAGTQVNPNQMAMMSTQINATDSLRILFDVWEGTRGVQLRVCCDAVCPFETELGVKKGSRNWQPREVICPKGTRQLSFECTNTGKFRGACGVDNIRMDKC